MAKGTATKGMHGGGDRKTRGRTSISGKTEGPRPTKPNLPQEMRRDTNRPVNAGGTKHRGDRRDMNKVYTGSQRHAARGNNIRTDVSTRKR